MTPRAAAIGECMIELREQPDGTLTRAHGGDTLNTAIYLARLGVPVDYVTALGDDPWSDEMVAAWQDEGIGTALVRRVPGRLPGLYIIQTNPMGERRFLHWRDSAAARLLFDLPGTPELMAALARYDLLYYSAITLSIYPDPARARLLDALAAARAQGARIAFDTNFRPRGWPDLDRARTLYRLALHAADIVLASTEDLEPLFGPATETELAALPPATELVHKLAHPAIRLRHQGQDTLIPASPVPRIVDTTAAGDSFAAAYLAARLAARPPAAAAEAGHRLAAAVIAHQGAIIPLAAMPPPEATQ